nr:sigma 54-interacting transcriptional regulator [Saprospiraceae bacterium]
MDAISTLGKKTVLIVEDEYLLAENLIQMVEEIGYEVLGHAMTEREATNYVRTRRPDLVLLDIQLGDELGGLALAEKLRFQWGIPFIFISSHTGPKVINAAKTYHPYGYIVKPVRRELLLVKIEMALYRAAYEDVSRQERERKILLDLSSALVSVRKPEDLRLLILDLLQPIFLFDAFEILWEGLGTGNLRSLQGGPSAPFVTDPRGADYTSSSMLDRFQFAMKLPREQAFSLDVWLSRFSDDLLLHDLDKIGIQEFLCFPLLYQGQRTGVFVLYSKSTDSLSAISFDLLQGVMDQVASAVANILAYDRIERTSRVKSLQLDLVDTFKQEISWRDKFAKVSQLLLAEIPFDLIGFGINREDWEEGVFFERIGRTEYRTLKRDELCRLFRISTTTFRKLSTHLDLSQALLLKGANLENFLEENQLVQLICRHFGSQVLLNLPLSLSNGQVFWVSFYNRRADQLSASHLQLLQEIGASLGLTLESLLAYIEIEDLSQQLKQEKEYLQEEIEVGNNFGEIIGESPNILEVLKQVRQVADTNTTVLITGETGTGKELVARAIHNNSSRNNKPLIKLNCAALPPQFLESELFGHEKGSFTGAHRQRIGKFELADQGTIFLDEVGELPIELQSKLLRVLQEREFERLGGNKVIRTDIRIITATNRNLEKAVKERTFRADLFFRLNVFPIHLPALRDRQLDIIPLAEHFLKRYSRKLGKPLVKLSEGSQEDLLAYAWPGNIRELEHIIERAVILNQDDDQLSIPLNRLEYLPQKAGQGNPPFKTLQETERELILAVLTYCKGKIRGEHGAAKLLDINANTLDSRIKKLGIVKEHVVKRKGDSA